MKRTILMKKKNTKVFKHTKSILNPMLMLNVSYKRKFDHMTEMMFPHQSV